MIEELTRAELELRCYRLELVLRAVSARANNWQLPTTTEYYKNGMLAAYKDISWTIEAGIRWATGTGEEPQ
jgi:hypothetical protein